MRTSNVIMSIALLGLAVGLSPAVSFDGTRAPEGAALPLQSTGPDGTRGNPLDGASPLAAVPGTPPPVAPLTVPPPRSLQPPTPQEAFRSGTQSLRQGKTDKGIVELEYAAEQGVPGAIWKLGRMYADGDGVKANKARSYEYFRRLTTAHADEAAGTPNDAIQAARWLRLSANKGDHRAQALLGGMLFKGEQVSRQAALGLFWLIIAKDSAGPDESWITDMYSSALAQASENDRALAHKYLEDWLKNRREWKICGARATPAGNRIYPSLT